MKKRTFPKYIKNLSLIFLIIIIVNPLVNATQIWTNDEIKVDDFREKIDIYQEIINGEGILRAKITDVFSFSVPEKLKNETIFFVLTPPYNDFSGKIKNVSNVKVIGCQAGDHKLNYSLDETFGLSCPRGEFTKNLLKDIRVNGINLIEFNASELDWVEPSKSGDNKISYISISYILDDLVLETKTYNTLWVRKIKCDYHSPECIEGQTAIYVSIPSYFFVSGGYNYQILEIDKEEEMMIFFQKDSSEDMVLSYEDTKKTEWDKIKWFMLAILFSFLFSIVSTRFSEIPDISLNFILVVFVFLLIIFSCIVLDVSPKVPIIVYLVILLFISLWIVLEYFFEGPGIEKTKKLMKKIKKEPSLFNNF